MAASWSQGWVIGQRGRARLGVANQVAMAVAGTMTVAVAVAMVMAVVIMMFVRMRMFVRMVIVSGNSSILFKLLGSARVQLS